MTRVLVTGGTGFLGLPCVHLLAGAEVHVVGRSGADLPPAARFHPADLFDPDRTREVVATVRPTHLLHLAWMATPGAYWTSPDNPRWVEASLHLLRAFADHGGRRAVLAGTCAEYDWTVGGACREFETPVRPATLYGRCKNELRERAEGLGLDLAWARLFFVYGPREHPARLVPSVARALLAGEAAECTAGAQVRDFLSADDAAGALVALLHSGVTGPVNVASGAAVPVRAVVERVAAAAGRSDLLRLGTKPTPPGEPPVLAADVRRLRDEVGWRPRVPLGRGVEDAVAWWRDRRAG
jgi:nucleoside-diphosphate-sugar epimerase